MAERNYTELPTLELEDRFYHLTESAVNIAHSQTRREAIAMELRYVVFELDCRTLEEGRIAI